ncbi:DUF6838 family protein [Proteiniborus sp. MB09-C3]|uniref:phage tail terminator family protein n=1 Tax=Proteiniborus sp. MB09-C3 TaxID=3050072 RepID=UPI0025556AC2|nr:hypothetical protein [Proteiniborus sp. MB09-C3]WIV11379.1 hypothetical protein QO263_14845 [Proteiniborus sp. MB09-C3]
MINSIKQSIINKLLKLYPEYTIYDENVPENFEKKSFLIKLIDQKYNKRLNSKYKSIISFDVAYFSDKSTTEIKSDCLEVQLNLIRTFDLIGTYRALNKQATITDNVLHFKFDINYSEIRREEEIKMQTQQTTTNI